MKLTAFILLTACLQVSARGYSQTVTLSEKNAPLQKIFRQIHKQTGFQFFYKDELLSQAGKIDIEVKNVPLETVLEQCFQNLPFTYTIVNKTIVVKEKVEEKKEKEANAPPIDIHGRVTDSTGGPLVGASVTVRGSRKGTITDAKGEFELKGVDDKATLIISFTGYGAKELKVHGQTDIGIVLSRSTSPLDQVQVIAYGTVSKRLQTGNVSTVKADEIEKQPVSNPLLALQGRVPGLYITQASGLPGSGVTVRIQGQNSIRFGNDPLYVIDGVPYASQTLSTTIGSQLGNSGGPVGSGYGNPMNYINPSDIESIDVLKDADATAIYGSRAANGAILVTTKKGKAGKNAIDVNIQSGWGNVASKVPLLNTQQYLQVRHEALRNDGLNPYPSIATNPNDFNYDINGFWDTTRYTDWQKVLLGGTARYTNINASLSGGSQLTQYLVGGTFHRETSVYPGNNSDVKGSVHFSLNMLSSNQKLRVQLTGSYLQDNNNISSLDPTTTALILPPDAPKVYNPDGTLNWQLLPNTNPSWGNPFAALIYNPYQNKTYNLVASGVLSYQILRGLVFRSNLGYTNMVTNEISSTMASSIWPGGQAAYGSLVRAANYSSNLIRSWIIEPQLEYKAAIGAGKLEMLFGGTFLQNNSNGYTLTGRGYNSDALLSDVHSAANVSAGSSAYTQYNYDAIFGRLNYNWKDKYLVNLTGRRDGSSRFGPESQFHNFWSVGAGWVFSQENFFKNHVPVLNFGKLRGSYGTTGSDQITDYAFMNLYSTVSAQVPYQNVTGLGVSSLPNPYLQWEETRKLQFGIDLSLLQNRVSISANYAINRSSNELLSAKLPTITGFRGILLNAPVTVENRVTELVLSTINIKTKNFNWSTTLNFTVPKNRILAYHGNLSLPTLLESVGYTKVFHLLGVDPSTGQYSFSDSHGKATSNPQAGTDNTAVVNANLPIKYGGLSNSIRYKSFQLDFLLQYVNQIGKDYFTGNPAGTGNTNQPVYVLNRWQKPGDLTSTQRFNSQYALLSQWTNMTVSDAAYSENATYLRMKNISISYVLSENFIRKARIQSMRIYAQGQNLFTITSFKGLDPETGNTVLPPLRVVTVGVQIVL